MRNSSAPAEAISARQAARLVQSGMWLDYGAALSQPDAFDKALAGRIHELRDVKLRNCLSMRPRAVLDADPGGDHIFCFSLHFSGYDRKMHDAGRCNYIPVNLGEIPDYYRRFMAPVDIAILKTRPLDENGYFNLGGSLLWHRAIIESAKLVIVETSDALPYTYGEQASVHISEVDYIIEGDDTPLPELPNPPPSPIDRAVANFVAGEIQDGACLQIGIGS